MNQPSNTNGSPIITPQVGTPVTGDTTAGATTAGAAATPSTGATQAPSASSPAAGTTATTAKKKAGTSNATSKLRKPKGHQADLAIGAAAEARTAVGTGDYTRDFGPFATDGLILANGLEQAGNATITATKAEQASKAANVTRNTDWDATIVKATDPFQPYFEQALERDATIADRYPLMTMFYSTGKEIGQRAAATRKAKAKASSSSGK